MSAASSVREGLLVAAAVLSAPFVAAAPVARCDGPAYDFGKVMDTAGISHVFCITNAGDQALILKPASVCCGAKAVIPQEPVAPGQGASISVQLNLRGRRGATTKAIYLSTNDPRQPHLRLALSGTVLAGAFATPYSVDFSDCAVDTTTGVVVRITSDVDSRVRVTNAWSTVPWLKAAGTGEDGASGIRIETVPPLPSERASGTVRVGLDMAGEPLVIPVTVSPWEPFAVSPRNVILSRAGPGAPGVSRFVVLTPRDGVAFRVTQAAIEGAAGSVAAGAVAGGRWRLHIRDLALPSATSTGSVVVATDHPSKPVVRIPVWAVPETAR